MKRLPIEVEPLSDERWARIERSLMARWALDEQHRVSATPRARRELRFYAWLAAALLVGLGGLFVVEPWRGEDAEFDQPTRITTGRNPSHLTLPGLALDVEPESAVVMGSDAADGLLLVLDRGTIVCRVAKRPTNDPLIVQAGGARVRVLGTRFRVTRLGESARVDVFEGAVEVTFEGNSTRVGAGEEWSSEVRALQSRSEGADTPRLAPRGEDPSVRGQLQSAGVPSPSVVAARDHSRVNGEQVVPRSVREPRAELSPPVSAALPPRADNPVPAARQGERATRRSAQALFEEATALERTDPSRASQLYAELQTGSDSWAQNALYARGRLEVARGNHGLGRRLLERYLERFPRGSNAEDARAVLGRLR